MNRYNLLGLKKSSLVVRKSRYILLLVMGALCIFSYDNFGSVYAKTPGKTYCHRKTCHRVKTLNETKALIGRDIPINASFYDGCSKDRFNSCGLTSSGEVYKPHKPDNAASSVLPDGTIALVWSQISGEAIVLRINNAGPYWGNRKLDLSAAAARKLGIKGVEEVTLRVIKAPTEDEARFEKNRSYDPVIGPLGKFASLELAQKAMSKIRSDGLKTSASLASLENSISSSSREVKIASLEESIFLSSASLEKGDNSQVTIAQSQQNRESLVSSQTTLSPLSKVKDFLSNWKSQMLSSNARDDIIEPITLKELSKTTSYLNKDEDAPKGIKGLQKTYENTQALLNVVSSQDASTKSSLPEAKQKNVLDNTASSITSHKHTIKPLKAVSQNSKADIISTSRKGGGKSSPALLNKVDSQVSSETKVASLISRAGEKYRSQKFIKKNS